VPQLVSMLFFLLIGTLGIWGASNFGQAQPVPSEPSSLSINQDVIRVGLASSGLTHYVHQSLTLVAPQTLNSTLTVTSDTGDTLWQGPGPLTVKRAKDGPQWVIAAPSKALMTVKAKQVTVTGTTIGLPSLKRPGGVPFYRGMVTLQPTPTSGFYVVNTLPMQDYLKAVVPNELPARFGLEAVKAQSVAARNYALRPRENFWKAFDICDSQYCQAYYGAQTETPATNQAVDDTEGLVLLYKHQFALTVFSSTAGGLTEAYAHVFSDPVTKQFPAPGLPYLTPTADTLLASQLQPGWDLSTDAAAKAFWTRQDVPSFDSASPYYRWVRQWSGPQLQQAVAHGLLKVSRDGATRAFVSPWLTNPSQFGTLKSLKITERGKTGKAMRLLITTNKGVWQVSKEFLIRSVLNTGGKLLPSGNVVLTEHRTANGALSGLTAQGGGLGHGVGMSQFGASGMAKQGYTYDQILQQYYPGTVLGTRPIQVNNQHKQLTFRLPGHLPDTIGLWVQGGSLQVKLNGKPVSLAHRKPDQQQCYPLPVKALLPENTLQLYSAQAASAWLEMTPCY
jgi:SpoIID/LytB domain protein